jgi:hypothetical protein
LIRGALTGAIVPLLGDKPPDFGLGAIRLSSA